MCSGDAPSPFLVSAPGGLDGCLQSHLGHGPLCLGLLVQLVLLSSWCIRFARGSILGPGRVSVLLPLTRSRRSGVRLHFLACLANPCQASWRSRSSSGRSLPRLSCPQRRFSWTTAARNPYGNENLGLVRQAVDLLLQVLCHPKNPLVAHGLVLGGFGLNLRAIERHVNRLTMPIFWHSRRIYTSRPFSASKLRRRNSLIRLLTGC